MLDHVPTTGTTICLSRASLWKSSRGRGEFHRRLLEIKHGRVELRWQVTIMASSHLLMVGPAAAVWHAEEFKVEGAGPGAPDL